ncbi:helix-turn-helix transcriptional regulator [Lactococcus hircilactis]|uniref:helix-turn-helix transcriptional regulator n=1 Tax=Lactococcus hircilactis TaxID=1494462 RepID=UPI003FA31039
MAYFISQKMKFEREKMGLTIREFGSKIEKSHVAVLNYESGKYEPDLETIEKIALVLNLSFKDLVMEKNKMTTNEQYQLTLNQEVMKEYAATVLAELSKYLIKHDIEAENDPLQVLFMELSAVKNQQIFNTKTNQELDKIQGYLDGIKRFVSTLSDLPINEVA